LTIIHPQKRDGGIMNCFINNKKELDFDQKLIIESCLQKIAELSPNNQK